VLTNLARTKRMLVLDLLDMKDIVRPDISTLDISSERSIEVFIARDNIECAFLCDPSKSVKHVEMLCRIA
jgi:hypothetical protein